MGSYVFRWPYPAKDVHVTGSFDDWGKTVQMDRVGDHWEKEVDLPSADEKVFYKFVVDDVWMVDDAAPKEGDGHYNTNNVLVPQQITRSPVAPSTKDGDVPGAFPETPATEYSVQPIPASSGTSNPITLQPGVQVPDQKNITSETIGSTVTTSKEDYEKAGSAPVPSSGGEASEYSINPLPATSGAVNPVDLPAGARIPDQKDITPHTIGSTVTTSEEDYEKAGSATVPPPSTEESTFSVNPIPASSGAGNPIDLPAGARVPDPKDTHAETVDSTVTTSKEDYENAGSSEMPTSTTEESTFSVNPIPASSGIGNPVSIPAGEPLPEHKDVTPHTVDSTVTTSQEDYEKAGSSAFPAYAAAGTAVGGAAAGAALASAFSVPSDKKNIIPESSLPMGTEKTDTLDAGPFMRSSGPGTTTAALASNVPLEEEMRRTSVPDAATTRLASDLEIPLRHTPFISSHGSGSTTAELASKVPREDGPTIRSSGPGSTTAALAANVPREDDPTFRSSGPGSTTAALAANVPREDDPTIRSTGPETTTASLAANVPLEGTGTSSSVPAIVQDSIARAHEDPEAAASPEVVKEKADLEKELLSKTHPSEGTGVPASAAASGVPNVVTESISQAHASPEAAASPEAVKEKSDLEKELLSKTHPSEGTGVAASAAAAGVPNVVTESISRADTSPEAVASPEAVKEKADLEKELLSKTQLSEGTGAPASAAAAQTSFYGLATSVPAPVEKSMQQAHAAPEAAADASLVAEKSAVEHELLSKIPSADEAGEPAPTIAAATSSTAPVSTTPASSSAVAAATSVTDGKTANEPVPDTDTSSAARGPSAGELAGGAAVGGAAAAGAAGLAARHKDADVEPPRIADEQKPDITTEASPATASVDRVPGQSASAAAAVSDGAGATSVTETPKTTAAVEHSEAATTEYAPVIHSGKEPGVSSAAAAMLSDGTEDPTLADEPAVKMMAQNEGTTSTSAATAPATTSTTAPVASTAGTSFDGNKDPSALVAAAGVPSLTSAGTETSKAAEKTAVEPAATPKPATETKAPTTPSKPTQASAVQSPASSTATSTATEKKKKKHRLSRLYHKIFD